jgi:bifunctional non-homologous end joining protein LigD
MSESRRFGRYTVRVTSGDKVLFPYAGIRKRDLIDYYSDVGDTAVRYMGDRPVSMHRYPAGISDGGFFQKQAGDHFPDWIRTVRVKKEGGYVDHPVITNTASLVYLAQLGTITPHVWLSKVDRLHQPDQIVIDLDPAGDKPNISQLREAAIVVRDVLESFGMKAFVMLTGSKGVHVRTPIRRGPTFDDVKVFAREVSRRAVNEARELLTDEQRIAKREGKIFVDILRNAYAQTAVPPYAVRAREGAPVAAPITWEELSHVRSAGEFDIHSMRQRLTHSGDSWSAMHRFARSLPDITA